MTIFGLGPGAQVIILQALSAYSAIFSAYFFARPVLRGQTVTFSKEILSGVEANDDKAKHVLQSMRDILDRRSSQDHDWVRRSNRFGYILLAASLLILTGAVVLQAETDPLFRAGHPVEGHAIETR